MTTLTDREVIERAKQMVSGGTGDAYDLFDVVMPALLDVLAAVVEVGAPCEFHTTPYKCPRCMAGLALSLLRQEVGDE